MVVCAHGNVTEFCEKHEMKILTAYDGSLEEYRGDCAVVVTDQKMTRLEYDSLKCVLFGRGVELVSTEWTDDEVILRLLLNQIEQRGRRGGRQPFGFCKKNGQVVEVPEKMAVARRIIELRDAGWKLRQIQADSKVCHPDGGELAQSTIQIIIKNRERYEK